jgi:hypothetical protein
MPLGRWGTVAEAARHYGVTRQSIHKAIRKGGFADARLVTMPRGPFWLLPYPFVRRELRTGRPPKGAGKENGDR